MARGLAFVQFLIICLGALAFLIFAKLIHPSEVSGFMSSWAYFLGKYALWLIPLPILWAVLGNFLTARFGENVTNVVGLTLTAILFVVFAIPLFWYLN